MDFILRLPFEPLRFWRTICTARCMQNIELVGREIRDRIYFIRATRVILDRDLASLYQVSTKSLNQSVRRNSERFPPDFMFQLTEAELIALELDNDWTYLPYAFSEQGVSMLSSVIKSKTAVHVNIAIMRTFVKIRSILETNQDLAKKLNELEQKYSTHDQQLKTVFDAIRQLMSTGSPVTQKKIKGLSRAE